MQVLQRTGWRVLFRDPAELAAALADLRAQPDYQRLTRFVREVGGLCVCLGAAAWEPAGRRETTGHRPCLSCSPLPHAASLPSAAVRPPGLRARRRRRAPQPRGRLRRRPRRQRRLPVPAARQRQPRLGADGPRRPRRLLLAAAAAACGGALCRARLGRRQQRHAAAPAQPPLRLAHCQDELPLQTALCMYSTDFPQLPSTAVHPRNSSLFTLLPSSCSAAATPPLIPPDLVPSLAPCSAALCPAVPCAPKRARPCSVRRACCNATGTDSQTAAAGNDGWQGSCLGVLQSQPQPSAGSSCGLVAVQRRQTNPSGCELCAAALCCRP